MTARRKVKRPRRSLAAKPPVARRYVGASERRDEEATEHAPMKLPPTAFCLEHGPIRKTAPPFGVMLSQPHAYQHHIGRAGDEQPEGEAELRAFAEGM